MKKEDLFRAFQTYSWGATKLKKAKDRIEDMEPEYDYDTDEILGDLDDDMDAMLDFDDLEYWGDPEPSVKATTPKKVEEPKENITLNRLGVLWKQLTNSKTLQITGQDAYASTQFQLTDDSSKHVLTVIDYDGRLTLQYSGLTEFFYYKDKKITESYLFDLMKITKMLFKENALNSLEEDIAGR